MGDQLAQGLVCRPMSRSAATPEKFAPAPVPATRDLNRVRKAAAECRACPLWANATCTVFGEGPRDARLMLVGEQPGDQEDKLGKPFVGPAGKLLERALQEAGIVRDEIYVTNAVKHFKWTPQGKRRLHAKPNAREMAACRPWLNAEVIAIRPKMLVCLGATAAQQVTGAPVKVTQARGGTLDTEWGVPALITVHPSSLLRSRAFGNIEEELAKFVADLKKATQ
jgi:uracil-DNA glycosylase